MQQLTIEHKKSTSKYQKTEQVEEIGNKREGHGRNIALTRKVLRIVNSDTFYVESESTNSVYYFVRYEPSFHWCSCLDNSTRHVKCKHIFGVEYSIRLGTLKDTDKLPVEAKRYSSSHGPEQSLKKASIIPPKSYRDDSYDF
jgi:hypothetical protein